MAHPHEPEPRAVPPAHEPDPSDLALLRAHVAGDSYAFRELVLRHRDHLWQVALRTSYTREDADDALQEALLSAHRTAANFRADAAVRSWLHRIVVNACLDRIRRNKARPSVSLSADDAVEPRDQHDHIADFELSHVVRSALFSLPPDQRAALVAVFVEGLPVAEAAQRLGVPVGTVKSRCARGRRKLATTLASLRDPRNRE
ncbi:MAG TPA: RNA polymerase sigma factor SigM [Aldersonia sp.]